VPLLEQLTPGTRLEGLIANGAVTVLQAQWHGSGAVTLTYRDDAGNVGQELVYREDEPRLSVQAAGQPWSFDADGGLFRLASEARRIHLAWMFDPFLAVQTSNLDPLPHQIDAVYGRMLERQPLRFLLADDPGAGKTIMAGLYIKELMIRGDIERCLIVAPGSLVTQWQDELWDRFRLDFDILTRDQIESARTGNPFAEKARLIARLDQLARNEDIRDKLAATDWDLAIFDEAHRCSASRFGDEVKKTKRYALAEQVGGIARHLLLMTATPHSGKPENFQLFMALLDSDRFEGRMRDGQHEVDTSDLMRRLVKEKLLRFDGRPLFPERRAYSPSFPLSDQEAALYHRVTEYVSDEMNRAERLKTEGEGRRGVAVGFALTTMQRRLASSTEAIYRSLERRRKRLEARLAEERLGKRSVEAAATLAPKLPRGLGVEDLEDFDEGDFPDEEVEELEDQLVDQASAARTIRELELEIATLGELERLAKRVRDSGADRKWEELSSILQTSPEMFDASGARRKLIVFTEHRDTLNYLLEKLRTLIGKPEAVVAIHGGVGREERKKVQEAFTQDKDVVILVATDAAGEGLNFQRAHLVVNYDLPWNPNRIEQRFGRVHRIGQTEVCHLWNLVAEDTREGQVFTRLFEKLEEQRKALGDQVFDVLGEAFRDSSLRDLLLEAIRYGERPDVKNKLNQVVDATVGDSLRGIVHERALSSAVMSAADVERIKEDMARAEARKLQPQYLRAFFLEAFRLYGGRAVERETGRFELTHVPAELRRRDRVIGMGAPILTKYERITFEKDLVRVEGKPLAEYMCPGHSLLDSLLDLVNERYGTLLKQGAVLVDPTDDGDAPRLLVYLEHAVQDGRMVDGSQRRVVSRRFEFVDLGAGEQAREAGWAPYLDCRPIETHELQLVEDLLDAEWLGDDPEQLATEYAIGTATKAHLDEVRRRTLERVERTSKAVRERLETEIRHWDHRANQLREQELAGKIPRLNSGRARGRADELQARMNRRLAELESEKQLSSLPPVVIGGALVIPAGLLARRAGAVPDGHASEPKRVERVAVDAVMATERALGRMPHEMPPNNKGYDIESRTSDGDLIFIEVKGRIQGAETVTVTRSEIGVARNTPDRFILALVEVSTVESGGVPVIRYLYRPFEGMGEPHFATVAETFDWKKLIERSEPPS
jgi:SNF2 family DNA or RNA helicase